MIMREQLRKTADTNTANNTENEYIEIEQFNAGLQFMERLLDKLQGD